MHELAECSMRHHLYPQKYFFEPYDHREQIYKVPFLDDNFLNSLFPYCSYNPTYARPHEVIRYKGAEEVFARHIHVYPCDCSWQKRMLSPDVRLRNYCLSEQVSVDVVLSVHCFMIGGDETLTHNYTHTHIYTHTRTHTRTHTHTHTHIPYTDTHTHTHARTHKQTHTNTQTHTLYAMSCKQGSFV